jgi:dienelactone hydrolase
MSDSFLDTLDYSIDAYDGATRSMEFNASTRTEVETWQRSLRPKIVELLGGFPSEPCDLSPRVVETRVFSSYSRETVLFQSRSNMTVFGYFLVPTDFEGPGPAILCLPGHGRGVDDVVGIRRDGGMRTRLGGYQKDFALQCVARGYAVLAIEQLGFGHRRDEAARNRSARRSSCQPSAGAALMLGQTMIGWRVWDAMRSIDYLSTRAEVDPERVGVMGISGGGTTAFFSAALDERVKAAVVSGYFCTFRDSMLSISHCMDNYIPGVLDYAEMYDIAGLIAPRAMFAESGDKDPIFPAESTRYAVGKAREIYRIMGAEDRLGFEVFHGPHTFHGVGAFEHLAKQL